MSIVITKNILLVEIKNILNRIEQSRESKVIDIQSKQEERERERERERMLVRK